MKYPEALEHFKGALRADAATPPPVIRIATVDDFHEWKEEMRAYDAARFALGLATAKEIQLENAIIPPQHGRARIVTYALHGRRAAQSV